MSRLDKLVAWLTTGSDIHGKVMPFRDFPIAPLIAVLMTVTIFVASLAALLEWNHISAGQHSLDIEGWALILVTLGFVAVIGLLTRFGSVYLYEVATAVCIGGTIHVFIMVAAGLFYGGDPWRAMHSALWFHPIFIVTALTQSPRSSQAACWSIIVALGCLTLAFGLSFPGPWIASSLMVSLGQLLLSLCTSALLLYGLSVFRQLQGADQARIEALQEAAVTLRAEVQAKEKAYAELEGANAVVSSFLNNISHELHTPLNAVIGFSELIRDELFGGHANPKYKEYASDIHGSGMHLLELVDNLLYFSNLSAGRISLHPVELDANDIVREIAGSLHTAADRAGVKIVADVADKLMLMADRNGLARILHALLDNAIKFSHHGGEVFIQARQLDNGGCEISVRDTGIGIAKAEQEDIFKPFRKGKQAEKGAIPGVGMGLAMAKMLIDLHGGTISFASDEGAGTGITVTLPAQLPLEQTAQVD